jgi:hypothetical protein
MLLILILIIFSYLSLFVFVKVFNLFHQNIQNNLNIEDLAVAGLASLSLILIITKLFNINPSIKLIITIVVSFIITILFFVIALSRFFVDQKKISKFNVLWIQNPTQKNIYWFLAIFGFYLLRAFLKTKSFTEVVYIPSRYNTDIFLYLRRISIFLSNNTAFNHQYDQIKGLDILYDSPKLLSSLVYAIFSNIFNHPGIAGTILTSLILTAIVLKYILLIILKIDFRNKLFYFSLITFILFQPALSWLQDQFYLSNLLYLYLLIYTVEEFFSEKSIAQKIFFKFTLASIAVAGFYPSQIPLLALATVILFLLREQKLSSKVRDLVKILAITITILIIFSSQYFNTTEVSQHFNLTDATHGVNFVYTPFWSLLSLIPRPGGFKLNFASICLVIISMTLTVITTKYLVTKKLSINKYLYLTAFLYIIYSISFLIFPGSYRQGKFFVSYIIPLALFVFLKILTQTKIQQNKMVTVLMLILAIYVSWNSLTRKYKLYIPQKIEQTIEQLNNQERSIVIYNNNMEHKDYYLSYQLQDKNLFMISHCPSQTELKENIHQNRAIVIANSCQKNSFSQRNSNITYLELSPEI